MWLPRILDAVVSSTRPVVLVGGEGYGGPFVIEALRRQERLAWAAVPARLHADPIGQGNALATALNGVLGAPLFAHALPARAHLHALKRHRQDLAPLWLALSIEAPPPGLLEELLPLQEHGYRILVDLGASALEQEDADGEWLRSCTVFGPEELRVLPEEAEKIVPAAIGRSEAGRLLVETGGRFTDLLECAHRLAQLPPLHVPSIAGPLLVASDAELVEPALAVLALQREGQVVEALELAVLRAPELVEELLRRAGPSYQEHGLLPRLHLLLSALPFPFAARERVLEWRLVAALAVDELASVVADVDAHLRAHGAPELRARRAGTLPATIGFELAASAVQLKRTPLTLWQYGRQHPDPEAAARLLKKSVELAEDLGTPYDQVRNAGALAAKCLHLGEFERAAAWASWALQVFDQHHLRDGTRRLMLANDLAFARIMTGDLVGLHRTLADTWSGIEGSLPTVAGFYRGTMAALELALGRPDAALALLRDAYETSPRRGRSRYAFEYVRALNELGRADDALRVAREAMELSGTDVEQRRRVGLLARGMARAVAGLDGASDDLLEVLLARDAPAEQRIAAALHYLLATDGAAHHLPEDVAKLVSRAHPTALRVLSGPASVMQPVWDSLESAGGELRLEFLGHACGRRDGRRFVLPPRLAEVALALALNPAGVGGEQLNAFLTKDGGRPFTGGGLRGLVTRLRALLPVTDAPYRLAVPFTADVVEARARLKSGQVREAIALLRGPLLPNSQAPGVEEQRWVLEEELRQGALLGGDAEALYDLADRLEDDLEVWEATASALPAGDPRGALVRARMRRLEREYA